MILKPVGLLSGAGIGPGISLIATFDAALNSAEPWTSVALPAETQSGDIVIAVAARYNDTVPRFPETWTIVESTVAASPCASLAYLVVSDETETGIIEAGNRIMGIVLRDAKNSAPIGQSSNRWDGDDDKLYYDALATDDSRSWVLAFGVHHGHDIANVASPNADLTLELYFPLSGTRQDTLILLTSDGPTDGHAGGSYVVRAGTTDNGCTLQCEVKAR